MANDWSLLLHPVQQSKPSKTQSYNTKIPEWLQSSRRTVPPKISSSTDTKTSPKSYMGTETERFRSHRLSSRGAYLWETPNRGRFTILPDGGHLFLILFSNNRVGRAAQRLGVRAAFWNLKLGEQYDVTRTVIMLARQCQRFHVPWAIENPEKSLWWTTSQLQELSKMRNENGMTFDFCAFGTKWRKRATVLAGHVDSAAHDAVLRVKNTCNSLDMTPLINAHVHTGAECTL